MEPEQEGRCGAEPEREPGAGAGRNRALLVVEVCSGHGGRRHRRGAAFGMHFIQPAGRSPRMLLRQSGR